MTPAEYAAALVAAWPALADDQLERIAVLMPASTDGPQRADGHTEPMEQAS